MSTDVDVRGRDRRPIAFSGEQPTGMRPDLLITDVLHSDERYWVPLDEGSWSRPLLFDVTHGSYVHVMKVTRTGIIARHRHTGPVYAQILKGAWHYLEHDWVAHEGGFAFEPPGETHTLVVPEGTAEMLTLFHVTGALIYVDPLGQPVGYDDVFTRLELARRHYGAVGLADELELMVR